MIAVHSLEQIPYLMFRNLQHPQPQPQPCMYRARGVLILSSMDALPSFPASSRNSLSITSCSKGIRASVEDGGGKGEMVAVLKQPGGRMVAELVGAYNQLSQRNHLASSSLLLFNTLKLAIPILRSLPPSPRSPLSRALSVALILADLHMDAHLISAAILAQVVDAGAMTLPQVRNRIGPTTAHLLHETLRLDANIFSKLHLLLDDDDSAAALRKFCLTCYDPRALLLHLALKLDTMRHLHHLPRHQQHLLSLEVLSIHAPLAHALDAYALDSYALSLQLEDLSFRSLFPHSYRYLDSWLTTHTAAPPLHTYRDRLLTSLTSDSLLMHMVARVSVTARCKSRHSTMKKLLRDGRKPQDVNDIFGLRVVLTPLNHPGDGDTACYRAREIIQSLWTEIPSRSKDYIATPKPNGYRSLHMALHIADRPPMEVQIRTLRMDTFAAHGTASHALYKSGLTDPQEANRLKAIMIAALELAAVRVPETDFEIDPRDQVFCLLDRNNDGKISMEELAQVMEELGAPGEDAHEMMMLLDSNSDGSLSSDEFHKFQAQVELMNGKDDGFKTLLDEKLQVADTSGGVEEGLVNGGNTHFK